MESHHQPPYRRVLDAITQDIAAGRLTPGDRLPSVRDLADRYNVAQMTARGALKRLEQSGRAQPIHGVGWFVTEPAPDPPSIEERVAALERTVEELQDLLDRS